jgi:hypothetical protein
VGRKKIRKIPIEKEKKYYTNSKSSKVDKSIS